jgi:hypothetical protein
MRDLPAPDRRTRRITISALMFVLCCMLSTARVVWDTPKPSSRPDSTQGVGRRSDQRFVALKASLPERGVIGYIGEPGVAAVGDYYLAQYALAPLVIDHSPNHRLVVGNFPSSPTPRSPSENLQLVKDFGDGVLLLATKGAN